MQTNRDYNPHHVQIDPDQFSIGIGMKKKLSPIKWKTIKMKTPKFVAKKHQKMKISEVPQQLNQIERASLRQNSKFQNGDGRCRDSFRRRLRRLR